MPSLACLSSKEALAAALSRLRRRKLVHTLAEGQATRAMTTAAEILKRWEQQALDRLAAAGVDREGADKDRSRVQAWAAGAEVGEISALESYRERNTPS